MQPDHLPPELNTGLCCVVPAWPFRQPYMIFLFVGSSGLTEASFPRSLATPQLLLSNVLIILFLITKNPMTVFSHRGLSPHQFTPMSGTHKIGADNSAPRLQFHVFWLSIHLVAGSAALTGAVADLPRWAT